MNCLLIGGSQSVGKSESIYRISQSLISRGYLVVSGTLPIPFSDFRVVLEGKNHTGENIKIIINSATDTTSIIQEFMDFFDKNGNDYDILISSIRDDGFSECSEFFRIMEISNTENFILEIPFAKNYQKKYKIQNGIKLVSNTNRKLVNYILTKTPFNL